MMLGGEEDMPNKRGRGPSGRDLGAVFGMMLAAVLIFPQPADAQWTRTDWPGGGSVSDLAAIGPEIYAATGEGVFASTDGGLTWIARSAGLPPEIEGLRLAAVGKVLYAGCGEAGIFISRDGGKTWAPLRSGMPPGSEVRCLAACGEEVFVGTDEGLFLASDEGRIWTAIRPKSPEHSAIRGLSSSGHKVFALARSGEFYRMTKSGQTWNVTSSDQSRAGLNVVLEHDGGLLAGTRRGLAGSSDDGANWTPVAAGPLDGREILCLSIEERDILAGTDAGVFRSADGGATWVAASSISGLPAVDVGCLLKCRDVILAGSAVAGVFVSRDRGSRWECARTGWAGTMTPLAIQAVGRILYAGVEKRPAFGGIVKSSDGGRSWTWACTGLPAGGRVQCIGSAGGTVLAGTTEGLYRSDDAGATWLAIDHKVLQGAHIECLQKAGPSIWAGTRGDGMFRSENDGRTWRRVSGGLSASATVSALCEAGHTLVCATNLGLCRSEDGGGTWEEANEGLPGSSSGLCLASIGSISFAGIGEGEPGGFYSKYGPRTPSRVEGHGVFAARGPGLRWTRANRGLPDDAIVFCLTAKNGLLFAGTTRYGIFISFDGAESWQAMNKGLPKNAFVGSIGFDGTDILVGLQENGIFRGPVPVSRAGFKY